MSKIDEFQDQLEKKHSMLQKLEHSLSDKDAELNMEKQTNKVSNWVTENSECLKS